MPYDALGNYIPGDDEPSLDEMRLAVTQKAQPAYTQIPTQGYPKAPAPQRPLDTATQTFQDVATRYNPLMIMKALREGVGATIVNPVIGGLQGVATELQSPEFYDTSRTKPTGIAEGVAADFMQRNAPTTPLAQEFTEAIGKYTQDLPAYLGHLSTNRPVLTPNDVRVLGAEATRLGRQVRDIPSDFASAQAGAQRIDPITGQPTMGAKLQAGAESIGDLMERRRMQGLAPVPGLPETLQPETRMYAMRPSGSRIALPQVPPTKLVTDTPINIAPYRILSEIVEDPKEPLPTVVIENMIDRERIARNISAEPFEQWAYDKAYQLYPDAPTRQDALEAWKLQFTNSNDLARAQLAWLDEYLATPEGQASPLAQLPSPTEIQERHKVASEWLYGPWLNYINKHVGASGDPAVKLASQGLTYSPASTIRELVDENVDIGDLNVARAKAGMPKEGEVAPTLKAKEQQLSELQSDLAKWQTRRQAYRDIAERQGLVDPAQLPDYAATTDPIRELTRNVAKLEEEVDNLRLGKAYEDLSDAAVIVRTQPESLARLEYPQQQFYPSITRARPEDLIYNLPGSNRLDRLGLRDLAQDVYNDIMSGKIPKEQVSKLSIDKLIREKAVPRIKQEKLAAQAQKTYKADAEAVMQTTLREYAAPEHYFGNVGVIELNNKMGLDADQLTKILSEATTVLDHCIAQGASAGERDNNPWMPGHKRKYEPIYNIVTGEKNPRAAREISSYAGSILNSGNMIADIRDRNTGIPVATLELSRSHTLPDGTPMYYVGWASGAHNGKVNPEYRDSIKEYLNARSDIIYAPGDNLARNLELYDTQSTDGVDLLRTAGISRAKASQVDLSGMPRFVTKDDIKAFVDAALDANQVAPTQQPAPARPTGFDVAQVNRDLTTAIDNAVQLGYDDYNMAVSDIVRDQVLRALPTNRLTEVTTPADMQALLRDGISLLTEYIDMSQLATSQNVQYAANPIGELIIDLQGINSAIERGIFTQEPTPPVPAVEPPGANEPQRTAAAVFRDLIDELSQEEGAHIADRVEIIAIRAAGDVLPDGSVVAAMRRRPAQFAQALRRLAQDEDSELVEMALHRLADEVTDFETPPAQPEPAPGGREAQQRFEIGDFDAYIQRVNRDVGFTEADRLVRVANTIARDMGSDTVRLALENRPTQFAERLAAVANHEENAQLQDVLFQLADEIAPPVRDLNEQLPELNFEPDVEHPANVPAFNPQEMAFELFQDTRRGEGRDLDELRTTLQALDNGNFDDMRFRALPENQRDRAQREVSRQIRAIMDDLNITIPAEPEARQQPTQAQRVILDGLEMDLTNSDIPALTSQLLGMTGGGSQITPNPYWSTLSPEQLQTAITRVQNRIRELEQPPQQQQEVARYQPIADRVNEMTYDQLRNALDPQSQGEVAALHDDIVRSNYTPNEVRHIAQMVYDHQMSQWEQFDDAQRAMLYMELMFTANRMEAEPPPTRRGPFQPGGASAVRGMPLGNLNLQPAITAEMLRGPDTQPVRNFVQQVGNLPGVTQEGLRTGLMAFEQMDPTRQMTKAEFVRELLPSSYDIVDLRGASQDNQHLMDAAQNAFDQDASPIGDVLGLKGAQLAAWANAVRTHFNDYDSFSASIKRALAKQGIENADEYVEAYDTAYRDALETYVANYAGSIADEDGYTYANTQRLVQTQEGDEYGEFGVTHPDQRGTYHHFDLAPQGVIGHFRGTYNPADPIMLNTEHWVPSSQSRNPVKQTFETKPNSYVIEEIQSDAQKTAQQTGHLHQVHGVLFKAAIQKALELGATTVYLPTARIIADTRSEEHYTPNGEYIPLDRVTKKFAPIYDQAIVKEGLKPLLKIPGVTSKVVNGYHEISFTPEAIEHILNGPGQSVPGYARGGSVQSYQDGGSARYPSFFGARDEAVERSEEMFRSRGQDDPADAARHMLASGYMAQSLGPTIAKGLGWLHEFKEAPIRTAGHALGLSNPRYDYEMDMHNNALGVELAQKAKNRTDFEQMVKDAIAKGTTATTPGRVRLMTPEQAEAGRGKLKYANGGTVSQTPSLDAMKYELMMRSK